VGTTRQLCGVLVLVGCSSSDAGATGSPATLGGATGGMWPGVGGAVLGAGGASAGAGGAGSAGAGIAGSPGTGGVAGNTGAGGGAGNPGAGGITCSPPPTVAPPLAPTIPMAVDANNAFGVALYQQLRTGSAGNIVTSPLSASVALTMAYAGAKGQTATEMAAALHLGAAPPSIFDGQAALVRALEARTTSGAFGQCNVPGAEQLQIVDAVWGERTYPWEPSFENVLLRSYATSVTPADFLSAPDAVRGQINDWVSGATSGAIKDLLLPGSLDAATRFVLVNAIHLKFDWSSAFDPARTSPSTFTKADGTTVSTPFMNTQSWFAVSDDGQAQTVALPLWGDQLEIVLTVPHVGVELGSYEASLTPNSPAFAPPKTGQIVQLSIPRVTFTSRTFSLAGALQAMGLHQAFDRSSADFTGMCARPPGNGRLFIGDVVQKAMVEMVESGVVAAAATGVVGSMIGLAPPPPMIVKVDRPYLFSIVDQPTGAVLFLGRIEDPTDPGSP